MRGVLFNKDDKLTLHVMLQSCVARITIRSNSVPEDHSFYCSSLRFGVDVDAVIHSHNTAGHAFFIIIDNSAWGGVASYDAGDDTDWMSVILSPLSKIRPMCVYQEIA